MSPELEAHFFGPGPKRILSLDGGGVRGIVELAFLERLEDILRAQRGGDPAFRLCQWFDLIGGTSTGAIIAALLAIGLTAAEVKDHYMKLAPDAFRTRGWRILGFIPRFQAKYLSKHLSGLFGDMKMESEKIRTGLAIMSRRYDTGSPWLLSNNPRAPYWPDPLGGSHIGNCRYKLADIVRASTAAPGFFQPMLLPIIEGEPSKLFIDGGLSPYNNPSLQLMMLTQAEAFGLKWPLGADNLTLLSIGTGNARGKSPAYSKTPRTSGALVLRSLMDTLADGQLLTLTLLQWFSDTPAPWKINSEIGDLGDECLGGKPLLRFQRFDMPLDAEWLQQDENLGITLTEEELVVLRRFDRVDTMKNLYDLAKRAALIQMKPDSPLWPQPSATSSV
jgi:hypothetical protein